MNDTCKYTNSKVEELVIPTDLKTFLNDIANSRLGYELGNPWKYSEESLAVVVPILRKNAPERQYTTMYEVLKQLNMKDTGSINQVELQNKSGMAIFVRAGTIFSGKTQNRAAQHSGVYNKKEEVIKVCCVHASHGIHRGEKMKFGDIAPPSVTMNLMTGNQSGVWSSVKNYTGGDRTTRRYGNQDGFMSLGSTGLHSSRGSGSTSYAFSPSQSSDRIHSKRINFPIRASSTSSLYTATSHSEVESQGTDNLLGHLQNIKKGQSVLDDMMQKVPLFDNQAGAIIFNPVGIIALETFDSPKSWEAIKKEIVEKYGDKIMEKQAEHLFELKPEMILPMFRKFIESLDDFKEMTIRKDTYSETREVLGKGVIGEYTLVKGQPIHVLLLKEDNT